MGYKTIGFFFILLLCLSPLYSEEENKEENKQENTEENKEKKRFNFMNEQDKENKPLFFRIKPCPIGLTLTLGYRGLSLVDGLHTTLWVLATGIYETVPFYRTFEDELLTYENSVGIDIKEDTGFTRVRTQLCFGFSQGLLWNEAFKENLLELFFIYSGRRDFHINEQENQIIYNQTEPLPDQYGIFQNSLLFGILLNNLDRKNRKRIKKGIYSEASIEYGPEFLANNYIGLSDYLRTNFIFEGYVPLFDAAPESEDNKFSIYLHNYLVFDWAIGSYIPINIRQSIGGFYGQSRRVENYIRCVEKGRFDANLKAINKFDINMNLPAFLDSFFVPGIILFFDSFYYDYLEGTDGGFVFTTGGGVFIDIFNKMQISIYTGYSINQKRLNGMNYYPLFFSVTGQI